MSRRELGSPYISETKKEHAQVGRRVHDQHLAGWGLHTGEKKDGPARGNSTYQASGADKSSRGARTADRRSVALFTAAPRVN